MFGICRNTWRTLRALAVAALVTSAVLSSSTSTRAVAVADTISRSASTNPNAAPNTRMYNRFSDLSWDTVNVRIYQGLHFRTADEVGRKQGRQVAEWVFGHVLQPIDGRD
jgi:hypothetical protein